MCKCFYNSTAYCKFQTITTRLVHTTLYIWCKLRLCKKLEKSNFCSNPLQQSLQPSISLNEALFEKINLVSVPNSNLYDT